MADKITKVNVVKIDTGDAIQDVDKLTGKIDELNDSTKDANKSTNQLNNSISTLSEASQEASEGQLDMVEKFENVTRVAAGVAGGFEAVTAGLNLIGVESESLDKLNEKMLQMMGLVQGLQAVAEGAEAFKKLGKSIKTATRGLGGFKTALIGTGIGAAVVLLGSLIANWDTLAEKLGIAKEKQDDMNESIKESNGLFQKQVDHQIALAKARGKSELAILRYRKQVLEQRKLDLDWYIFQVNKKEAAGIKLAEEEIENRKIFKQELEGLTKDIELVNAELDTKEKEAKEKKEKDNAAQSEKDKKKLIDDLKYRIDLKEAEFGEDWKFTEEGYKLYQEYFAKIRELYDEDSIEYRNATLNKIKYDREYFKIRNESEKEAEGNKLDIIKTTTQGITEENERETKLTIDKNKFIADAGIALKNTMTKINNELAVNTRQSIDVLNERIETQKKAILSISVMTEAISSILDSAAESEKLSEEKKKKLKIASLTIDTLKNATVAFFQTAEAIGWPWGAIPGAAASAAVLTAGLIQVQKMKSTPVDGSDTSGNLGGTPEINLDALNAVSKSQEVETAEVNSGEIERALKDSRNIQRVYVTESDIKGAAGRVNVAEAESTY